MRWLRFPGRRLRRDRRGATAVEFAIVGMVFLTAVLLLMETCWQAAIGAALDYGARTASRFGSTGATALPGQPSPPTGRAGAIMQLVLQSSGGLLSASNLTLSEASYSSYAAAAGGTGGTSGAGNAGQVVQYTLSYTQAFLTPLAPLITGKAAIIHQSVVTVLNEPFPPSS